MYYNLEKTFINISHLIPENRYDKNIKWDYVNCQKSQSHQMAGPKAEHRTSGTHFLILNRLPQHFPQI